MNAIEFYQFSYVIKCMKMRQKREKTHTQHELCRQKSFIYSRFEFIEWRQRMRQDFSIVGNYYSLKILYLFIFQVFFFFFLVFFLSVVCL